MRRLALAFLVSLTTVCSAAQTATRTPPFGSFQSNSSDTVNLANLDVHFATPIVIRTGRGMPFDYVMTYDNSIWMPTSAGGASGWNPVDSNWGWSAQGDAVAGTIKVEGDSLTCQKTVGGQVEDIAYPSIDYDGYMDPGHTFHPMFIQVNAAFNGCDVPVRAVT